MLEEFIKDMLKEKGLPDDLDPKIYNQVVKDLVDRAKALINRRLIDAMSDEQLAKFNKLIETGPDEKAVQGFIDANLAYKEQITANALYELRQIYLREA